MVDCGASGTLMACGEGVEALLEAFAGGALLLKTDGTIIAVNAIAARGLGKDGSELKGACLLDLLAREVAAARKAQFEEVARSGKAIELDDKEGGKCFNRRICPVFDSEGEVAQIAVFSRDITESKHTQEVVKATNAFLESVMESVTNMIFVTDLQERFSLVSKACLAITGYEPDELVDRPFSVLYEGPLFADLTKQLVRVRAMGVTVSQYETEMTRKDGRKACVSLNLGPLYEKGKIVSIVGTAEDITQRKKLEDQLLQAQKLESIGQLASGIAHEINTPMQYMGDNTRFLEEAFRDIAELLEKHKRLLESVESGKGTSEQAAEVTESMDAIDLEYLLREVPKSIEQILEGIDRVTQIVQAMKEFAHASTNTKEFIDLNKSIESAITVAGNEWKYVAEMETDFDSALPLVPCLPGEFNQVILNLIINATQAIADVVGDGAASKGTIRISTCQDGDWAEIRISDTGRGVPEEIRSRIFDPFFTTKEVGKGSGQGLAIARSIVTDKHDGTITLETGSGKGATFIVRLPIGMEKFD